MIFCDKNGELLPDSDRTDIVNRFESLVFAIDKPDRITDDIVK